MRPTLSLLSFLLLSACAGSNKLGTDLSARLDTLRQVVDDHVSAGMTVTTIDEFTALESSYDDDFGTAMGGMSGMMDDMMGCMGMDMSSRSSWMDDMQTHMDDMTTAQGDHGDTQAACTDLATCMQNETDHGDVMNGHMDQMDTDAGSWDDTMNCSSDTGGSGGMM